MALRGHAIFLQPTNGGMLGDLLTHSDSHLGAALDYSWMDYAHLRSNTLDHSSSQGMLVTSQRAVASFIARYCIFTSLRPSLGAVCLVHDALLHDTRSCIFSAMQQQTSAAFQAAPALPVPLEATLPPLFPRALASQRRTRGRFLSAVCHRTLTRVSKK